MVILFLLLGALSLLILLAVRGKSQSDAGRQLKQRNQDWLNFIVSYSQVAKTSKEKALVQRMLNDAAAQGFGSPNLPVLSQATPATANQQVVQAAAPTPAPMPQPAHIQNKAQLDNASLLLYLGAFMFVAAASLFVALGGQAGIVRMLVVLFVSLAFYASGIWLYRNRPKLHQAGQTFAGIGIVLAPLVGAAFYFYVLSGGYGAVVWALTSVFCLGLYGHALRVFKTALLGYVFIFTLLSLFESAIGVVHAPLYYYGWGLAAVGLALRLLRYWKGWGPELNEVSNNGATLFVPVSVVVGLALFPNHGAGQLGISLVLASLYYGLEVIGSRGGTREANAVASQLAAVFGVMAIAYGVSKRIEVMDYSLLAANVVQLGVLAVVRMKHGKLWRNFGTVLLALVCLAAVLALPYPGLLLVAVLAALLIAAGMWLLERRAEVYAVAALSVIAAPYVAGLLTFGPLDPNQQTAAGFGAVLVLLVSYLAQSQTIRSIAGGISVMSGTYGVAMMATLIYSFTASPLVTLLLALGLAVTLLVLYKRDHRGDWIDTAGLVLLIPVVHAGLSGAHGLFLLSTLTALAVAVALALRFRRETLRWVSTAIWLLLPVALGSAQVLGHWNAAVYAWSYIVVMAVMIFSRSVARGVIYLSGKVPMSSYAKHASLSYVVGYGLAAATAICVSLATADSRLNTTLILGVLTLTSVLLARTVEKQNDILAFVPVFLQAVLLSAIRPGHGLQASYAFALFSTFTAVGSYLVSEQVEAGILARAGKSPGALQVSVATAFVAPGSIVLGAQSNWLMACGLLVASLVFAYHIRGGKQSDREAAGGIAVLAVWWLLAFAHVHELQAYTHTVVALFAFYAYWRAKRGERRESDQYLWWMIAVATIPLALEALGGSAKYGWWLLLEQITILLVGISINRSFVTRWGLYVTVAAVLYQLRTYGYAALGLLALFLISLAIFQLQKFNERK